MRNFELSVRLCVQAWLTEMRPSRDVAVKPATILSKDERQRMSQRITKHLGREVVILDGQSTIEEVGRHLAGILTEAEYDLLPRSMRLDAED